MAGVLCWLAWHRSGYRRGAGFLELLRFVLIGLVALTLNQPEWLEAKRPELRPTLAVLHDQSNSMKTRDVVDAANAEKLATRAETIAPLLTEAFLEFGVGRRARP